MSVRIRERVNAIEGEFGFTFRFFIKDADGSAYTSLIGTETVTLYLVAEGGTAFSVGSGAVHDTATGEVRVTISSDDTASLTDAVYYGQVEISSGAALLITNDVEVVIGRRINS